MHAPPSERTEALFDEISAAATNPSLWANVLKNVAAITGSFGATLVQWNTACHEFPLAYSVGYPDGFIEEYASTYIASDTRVEKFLNSASLTIFSDAMLLDGAAFKSSACAHWLNKEIGQYYSYGVRLFSGSEFETVLSLGRSQGQGPAESIDLNFLATLIPHLRRSIATSWRFGRELYAQEIDKLPFGLVLLDQRQGIVMINTKMREIAAGSDGVALSTAGLSLANHADNRDLDRLVEAHWNKTMPAHMPGPTEMFATRPSGRQKYEIAVHPGCPSIVLGQGETRVLMICVTDPDALMSFRENALQFEFGLSRMEAGLAVALTHLGSVTEAAASCGIGVGTGRQYLKRIYSKMDVRGQVDLVTAVLRLRQPPSQPKRTALAYPATSQVR